MIGLRFEKILIPELHNMSQQNHKTTNLRLHQDNLESEKKAVMEVTQQSYSWPIPPASEIAKYETILPWSADRILKMAETQLEHRTKIEKVVLEWNVRAQILWVYSGFGIGVITLTFGFTAILLWHEVAGVIFWGSGLAWLVWVFVYWTRIQTQERNEKRKQLPRKSKE